MGSELYTPFKKFYAPVPPYIPIPGQTQEQSNPNPTFQQQQEAAQRSSIPASILTRSGSSTTSENLPISFMSTTQQQPLMGWDTGFRSRESQDDEGMTDSTPRPSDQPDHMRYYPYPELSLPHPSLNHDFRMVVILNNRISVGSTPFGHRNWISFLGGNWSGSWGSGIVLPGGQDSQLVIENGAAHLETNYILETYDSPPAHIVIKTHGWRTGPPEILAKLADPDQVDQVDPNSYKFRLFIDMETGDERYKEKLNCGMWVGSGMRKGAEVIYDAYRLS